MNTTRFFRVFQNGAKISGFEVYFSPSTVAFGAGEKQS